MARRRHSYLDPLGPDARGPVGPERRAHLLAMAAERVPLLRAELEFWRHLLETLGAGADAAAVSPAPGTPDGADPP